MFKASLEKLFDRYRTRGDAAALAEVFDRTSPELLKLAMHLVRESNEAEDVLQNTYLAAIERAESFDAARQLMPWLVGILAKQASLARRRSRRELEPDRVDERRELDPSERADLAEFSTKLAAALDSLPEPYREVLRLHLSDGRKPVDIARDLGRAPGTVRMQVHRGLDLLRRALPAGLAAGGALAILSPRGMSAIRERVLEEALKRAPLSTGATTATAAGGGIAALSAISIGAKLAVALLAIAAATWVIWPKGEAKLDHGAIATMLGAHDASAAGDTRSNTGPNASDVATSRNAVADARREKTSAAGASSAPSRWLVGDATGVAAAELSSVALEVRGLSRIKSPEDRVVRGVPASDGRFRLDVGALFAIATEQNPIEELVLVADHPSYLRVESRVAIVRDDPRSEFRADVRFEHAGVIEGSATAQGSIQVAALALENGLPEAPPADVTTCDAEGRFHLRVRDGREYAVLAIADGFRPRTRIGRAAPGSTTELGLLALERGATIDGRLQSPGGPLAGVLIGANRANSSGTWIAVLGQRMVFENDAFERGGTTGTTDARGHFELDGLEPGGYRVQVVRAEHALRAADAERRATLAEAPSTIELEPDTARIHLVIENPDRTPARGRVRLIGGEREVVARLSGDGRAELDLAPNAVQRAIVECDGAETETLELRVAEAGSEREERVTLVRERSLATLELTIAAPAGLSERELELEIFPAAKDGAESADPSGATGATLSRKLAIEDGRAIANDLPSGSWIAFAYFGGAYRHYVDSLAPAKLVLELGPGSTSRVRVAFELGGRLRLRAQDENGAEIACSAKLRDANGTSVNVRFVARTPLRVGTGSGRLSELGPNDVYPILAPGDYTLTLASRGRRTIETHVAIEAGKTAELAIVLPHTE